MDKQMQTLIIANKEDRRQVMAILADNGYTVRLCKIKVGKTSKIVVEFWREENGENGKSN